MGMKASQMMQVLYIEKPMYLASLKFSGILRVLKAYHVHRNMRTMLYPRLSRMLRVPTPQVRTAEFRLG